VEAREAAVILKSDIEISRKDAKPQRSGGWLGVIACMHYTNNFTSFTCSVNSFSGNFQARLGGNAALRDAKSGFTYHCGIDSS
jgi:hypothetical protein